MAIQIEDSTMLKQPVRTNISDFLKGTMGSQFVIPVYQRNYTWIPEKETAKFMSDIYDVLTSKKDSHFLGIIIHVDEKISSLFQQLQIVDGQQRLTTVFILLLAMKYVAQDTKDEKMVGYISDYYLYNHHASDRESLRLKPMVSSDDVYAKLVYSNVNNLSLSEKTSNVYRNFVYIRKLLLQWMQKYSLQDIFESLGKMEILDFPLSNKDDAQQIFESINATGAPLTAADLIRNYVLMNYPDEIQERYYRIFWQPMEQMYPESRRLEDYFRYFIATKTYALLNRKDVYEGFKQYWQTSKETTEEKLQEINAYCRHYYEIFDDQSSDKDIENCLANFRRNDTRSTAPFMMEMYHLFNNDKLAKKTFIGIIGLLDSYLMRRAIVANDTSTLGRYFPTLLRTIMYANTKKGSDLLSLTKLNLVSYNRGKALAMPTDEQIRIRLNESNAYALMCIRPLLDRLEQEGASAKVDTRNLNIEHIMPQSPNAYWLKNSKVANEDEYDFYANLIGNLTLCAQIDNVEMANHDFETKKKILSKTMHIRLNTELLKMKEWNKDTILKRCNALANQIIKIYPYPNVTKGKQKMQKSLNKENMIVLNAATVSARAIYHSDTDIEVLPGTTMKIYGTREMRTMKELFNELNDRGVLNIDDNQRVQFAQSWHFKNLNSAAQFLMHRGGENTAAWKNEDGTTFMNISQPQQTPVSKQANKTSTLKAAVKKKITSKTTKKSTTKTTSAKKQHSSNSSNNRRRNLNPRGIQPQKVSSYQEQKSANPFYHPINNDK